MADSLELFNAHQEDARRRADSLAKSIFILSGGTLTVSIGIFTGLSAPALTPELTCILKASWWGLFLAIIFLTLTLLVILARDYCFGERWRKGISDKSIDVSGKPTYVETIIWVLAFFGILTFLGGMFGQAYVATNVL